MQRGWGVGLTGDPRPSPHGKVRHIIPVSLSRTDTFRRVSLAPQKFQWIIASVLQGEINIWLAGDPDGPIPHLHFFAIGYPVTVPLINEEDTLYITSAGPGTVTRGTLILVG